MIRAHWNFVTKYQCCHPGVWPFYGIALIQEQKKLLHVSLVFFFGLFICLHVFIYIYLIIFIYIWLSTCAYLFLFFFLFARVYSFFVLVAYNMQCLASIKLNLICITKAEINYSYSWCSTFIIRAISGEYSYNHKRFIFTYKA